MGFFVCTPEAAEGLYSSHSVDRPKSLQANAHLRVSTNEFGMW